MHNIITNKLMSYIRIHINDIYKTYAYYYENMSEQEHTRIVECKIGILADSIRGNWNDISDRLELIQELCKEINRYDLIEEIEDAEEDIYDDGRWFRDCWSGPYCSIPDNTELYNHVRDIVEYVVEYDCSDIVEYDIEAQYRSGLNLRYGTLATKVRDNNATDEEVKEFIDISNDLYKYSNYKDKDKALEKCKFFLSNEDLSEEDKHKLYEYGSFYYH